MMTDDAPLIVLHRGANIFAHDPGRAERLERTREVVPLAPDELLHAEVPAVYVVRLGKLRVSQFLADGHEITRAVLQAGAALTTLAGGRDADPAADAYILQDIVLMALGEVELWRLPPGALET
jgi:hypothetical protein